MGLQFEPAVRFLQFGLPSCSSCGERLRLLEQFFSPHVRLDRVDHDTDRFGQLIEEGEVDLAERLERCQLDHGLDLAFEQHRQDDNVGRRRFAETGTDLDVIGRNVV